MESDTGSTAAVAVESTATTAIEGTDAVSQTEDQSTEQHSDQFSKKFAALSRREKEIRSKESEYEQKLADLEAKYNAIAPQKEEVQQKEELPLEYRLKRNPLQTLEEMGFGFEKLTELALNDGKLPADMQMQLMREELEKDYQSKFEELESKLTNKEKAEEEAKYDTVVNNFKDEIKQHVSADMEAYELINASESQELVFDIINEHYQETNRILPIEEAAQAVESHLLEEFEKFSKLKKLAPKGAEEPTSPFEQSPTLSNDLSAQSVNNGEKKLSDEESKARIAQLIKWTE